MSTELGDMLRQLRGNMSLREAKERTGLSHTYIRELEKGVDPRTGKEVMPSIATLKALAKAYDCDYSELLHAAGYVDEEILLSPSDQKKMLAISSDIERGMTVDQLMDRHTIWVDGRRVTAEEWDGVIAWVRAYRSVRQKRT